MMSKAKKKFSPEACLRAVRMVLCVTRAGMPRAGRALFEIGEDQLRATVHA